MSKQLFKDFVVKAKQLKGSQLQEAHDFIDDLFIAFGHKSFRDAGGKYEVPLPHRFRADYIWQPDNKSGVIIEMKSGTEKNLDKHLDQIFKYWHNKKAPRPRFLLLCNFNEFCVYDTDNPISIYDKKLQKPVSQFYLDDLPDNWENLNFLCADVPDAKNYTYPPSIKDITEKMCHRLGDLYFDMIKNNDSDKTVIQTFLLQSIFCMFSQSFELLPYRFFSNLLEKAIKQPDYAVYMFSSLFQKMNSNLPSNNAELKGIQYFNGGLFERVSIPDLNMHVLITLRDASYWNWIEISPSIFGSLFESTYNEIERHKWGLHYTHEEDIMAIVRPCIIEPWETKINNANSVEKLIKLRTDLHNYKVFDPACGCGNFLHISFVELRKLELKILSKIAKNWPNKLHSPKISGLPSTRITQLLGFDIQKASCKIAKLVLTFSREFMAREWNKKISNLGFDDKYPLLPLDKLNENIKCCNALDPKNPWPKCDVIIGNPPFQGRINIRRELGDEYVNQLKENFPEIEEQPDHCVYWFRKAHNHYGVSHIGFIGTKSIAENISRKYCLQYIIDHGGIIINAYKNKQWCGDAKVHVSIVNWVTNYENVNQNIVLNETLVDRINASLMSTQNFSKAEQLNENKDSCFISCQFGGQGFQITKTQAQDWIELDPKNRDILKPMKDGDSITDPNIEEKWVIDFIDMSLEEALKYPVLFEYLRINVKPKRLKNKVKKTRECWWNFRRTSPKMREKLQELKWYGALAQTSKYTCFQSISIKYLPCESAIVVASDDYYILGILNSKLHQDWVDVQKSTFGLSNRYLNTRCFNTFPFPKATKAQQNKVRKIMIDLESYRKAKMLENKWSISDLYNEVFNEPRGQLHQYHKALDCAVCECYGFKYGEDRCYNDELLGLNLNGNKYR